MARLAPGLFGDPGLGRRQQHAARRSRRLARDLDRGSGCACDRVQVDDRGDRAVVVPAGNVVKGPQTAESSPVGREEHERVGRDDTGAGNAAGLGIRAGQLDEHGGTAGVVVRPRADPEVVPVRGDDDRRSGLPLDDGGDVRELLPAAPRDVLAPGAGGDREPVVGELLLDPEGGARERTAVAGAGASGSPVGVEVRERPRQRQRGGGVERRWQRRRRQRRRARNREREQEQRQGSEQERSPVEAGVNRTLERTPARPLSTNGCR